MAEDPRYNIKDVTFENKPTLISEELGNTSWLAACFLLPENAIDALDKERREFTKADRAFGDCTIGGGPVFNMPPGWTENADIPTGFGMYGEEGAGYGPMFFESIVDNFEMVHLRAGMPEYNSLTNFYSNMYSPDSGALANHGIMSNIGNFIGTVAGFIVSIPVQAFVQLGRFSRWVRGKPYSSYYYLSPTMTLFWQTFNEAANQLAVKMGIVASVEIDAWVGTKPDLSNKGLSSAEIDAFSGLLPDVFKKTGGVDIFAAATRYKRLEKAYNKALKRAQESTSDYFSLIERAANITEEIVSSGAERAGFGTIKDLMTSYQNTAFAKNDRLAEIGTAISESLGLFESSTSAPPEPTEGTPPPGTTPTTEATPTSTFGDYEQDFFEHFNAVAASGADWITFAVDTVTEVSESFSNTAGESAVASTINGIVAQARNVKFGVMGGNVGDGVVSGVVEGAGSLVTGVATGAANMVGASMLTAMAGNGYVDIPMVWQESTSEFAKMSYSMELTAVSAHPLSKFQMMLPVLALICMSAPLSTGGKSYTSPLLVELAHKGKARITTGLIGNLSISRGGDIGDWDIDDMPLIIKVNFDVINLSNKVHIPIASEVDNFYNDSNTFSDYMTALAAVSLHDQESVIMELKRKSARMIQSIDSWTSPAHWGMRAAGLVQGSFLGNFLPPTNKR